jgi:hypothetical protein
MFDNGALAVHGFPGLVYNDTVSLKSDPEIIVYHDREADQEGLDTSIMLLVIGVVIITAAVVLAVFVAKRKKWI